VLGGEARCARRSGRGGEERGARMSVVELAGGVALLLYCLRGQEVGYRREDGRRPLMAPVFARRRNRGEGKRGVGWMREGGGVVQWLGFSWCTVGARRTMTVAGRTKGGGASNRRRETTLGVGQMA
jgi:hypothetical protein